MKAIGKPKPASAPTTPSKPKQPVATGPRKKTGTSGLSRHERMQQELEKQRARSSGPFYNVPNGTSKIRIMPPIDENGDWYFSAGFHNGIGPEAQTTLCPNLTYGDPCPICEEQQRQYELGTEEGKKNAKKFRARTRVFANAWVPGTGAVVWVFPKGVFETILSFFLDGEWTDLDDIAEGHNINIKRSGEELETKYEVKPIPKVTALGELELEGQVEDTDDLLSKRREIPSLLEHHNYDELRELLEASDWDKIGTVRRRRDS